jgi:hypothetical protein
VSSTRRVPAGLPPGLVGSMVKKRGENRKQKPQEEGKRRERTSFERMRFCDSHNFNVKSCRKLPGQAETSLYDVIPTPKIFYVKTRMCNYEQKSHRTKKRWFKDLKRELTMGRATATPKESQPTIGLKQNCVGQLWCAPSNVG